MNELADRVVPARLPLVDRDMGAATTALVHTAARARERSPSDIANLLGRARFRSLRRVPLPAGLSSYEAVESTAKGTRTPSKILVITHLHELKDAFSTRGRASESGHIVPRRGAKSGAPPSARANTASGGEAQCNPEGCSDAEYCRLTVTGDGAVSCNGLEGLCMPAECAAAPSCACLDQVEQYGSHTCEEVQGNGVSGLQIDDSAT